MPRGPHRGMGNACCLRGETRHQKIPIVWRCINTGLVSDLARPGGNITGFVALNVELEEKRLELLKEVMPHLSLEAVLGNSANPMSRLRSDTARRSALNLSIAIQVLEIQNSQEVERAPLAMHGSGFGTNAKYRPALSAYRGILLQKSQNAGRSISRK